MARRRNACPRKALRRWAQRWTIICALVGSCTSLRADELDEPIESLEPPATATIKASEEVLPELSPSLDDSRFLDPDAAKFDQWEPLVEHEPAADCEDPELRPFDWMRHWGFRHSSTDGRFVDKSVPLEYSSWLNRPYHVDWFVGPMLADDLVSDSVTQSNSIFGGLRIGWDFDYYWGAEWRFGWADPQIFADQAPDELSGSYFVTDVDFLYYPWGDTKVRPFFLLGMGATQLDMIDERGLARDVTLLTMPMGAGVMFPQTPWLAWRLEVIDNLAFGADGVDTMNNFAFTAGMELRMGARPNSYWPWRSSRTIW